jgi:subtilisin family serine protease
LGGGGFSQALQDAIERANAGILFIAAAEIAELITMLQPSYPASYPNANVIAVFYYYWRII